METFSAERKYIVFCIFRIIGEYVNLHLLLLWSGYESLLGVKKATGSDGLSSKLIKLAAPKSGHTHDSHNKYLYVKINTYYIENNDIHPAFQELKL